MIKTFEKFSNLESYEYVDRTRDRNLVQVDMFSKVNSKNDLKPGDRFISPPTGPQYEGASPWHGIVDSETMKPILLIVNKVSEIHVHFKEFENSKSNRSVAWDLCYKLEQDI